MPSRTGTGGGARAARRAGVAVACAIAAAAAVAVMGGALATAPAALAQPLEDQIFDALKPKQPPAAFGGTARALTGPKARREREFVQGLRTRSARSLTLSEREQVITIAKEKPNVDIEINFDYNSDVVGPNALSPLLALGKALSRDELKGTVFILNGHTDGKGGVNYNQDLSERRAEAVKRVLVKEFGLAPDTLIAAGHGKSQLKDPANPFAAENRRVQVVNTEVK